VINRPGDAGPEFRSLTQSRSLCESDAAGIVAAAALAVYLHHGKIVMIAKRKERHFHATFVEAGAKR
jgi:hypothetical protein